MNLIFIHSHEDNELLFLTELFQPIVGEIARFGIRNNLAARIMRINGNRVYVNLLNELSR